eukprot:gnl/MRDRNA2_/MRDRNA2_30503_c0_seq1.p1 gnl/MRDRNA2_/MRDRNA2_30503_c0~~gnl/MRDRNA2_/MRDRNA2_30503_c0_seq1.p1  ORF type:complete len:334 (-),score=53.43 gnl/MRDRNA2_/MRDRNA2_30503_c0_seq1:18-920(-)
MPTADARSRNRSLSRIKKELGRRSSQDAARAHTNQAFTGQMCAGQRYEESKRPDAMFRDPLAGKLAGPEGRRNPMGSWVMVPRTVYGDAVLKKGYEENGCRQLVLLGAGMDARAWRLDFPELDVYEVDLKSNFEVKENLVASHPLTVKSRNVVMTNFANTRSSRPAWVSDLQKTGFSHEIPTVWLLEGLMMYLTMDDQMMLMKSIGLISAQGSVVFHDAISKTYESVGVRVADVPFLGGSDEYAAQWNRYGGFGKRALVINVERIHVNRATKTLEFDGDDNTSPQALRGKNAPLFVEVQK